VFLRFVIFTRSTNSLPQYFEHGYRSPSISVFNIRSGKQNVKEHREYRGPERKWLPGLADPSAKGGPDTPTSAIAVGRMIYGVERKIEFVRNPDLKGKDPGPFKVFALSLPGVAGGARN
jgi:hypothetical protein